MFLYTNPNLVKTYTFEDKVGGKYGVKIHRCGNNTHYCSVVILLNH